MDFEWDPKKARSNQAKHGVSFEEATYVFEDLHLLEVFDDSATEERCIAIGLVGAMVHVVVYTERGNRIRIISARRAIKSEKDAYFQQAD
jgi:uncharacterized DUF497 family protein